MKKLLLLFFTMISTSAMYADDYTYFTIVGQDGTKTSITAVGLTITFSDNNLIASNSKTGESATIALSNLSSLNFSTTNETTGINAVETDIKQSLSDADGIYDLNGRKIPTSKTPSKGIYIVKKNKQANKIQIK